MELDTQLEQKLKFEVLKYLEKGRPNWDVPHTLDCVYWMKKLLRHEKGNPRILIPAIYLHDIGSAGLFNENNIDFESQQKLKKEQMKRSATLSEKILNKIGGFSKEEIEKIVHLVEVHDDLGKLKTHDELIILEADSLGQINTDKIKPINFSKSDYLKFLDFFEKERVSRFKTKTGKEFLNKLLPRAKRYCKENM